MPANVANLFLKLTVGKRSTIYAMTPIDAHPDIATRAWRLRKDDGACYDVTIDAKGHSTCECQAFLRGGGRPCKHCKALAAMGLLPKGGDR